jgi:hypothetical protein
LGPLDLDEFLVCKSYLEGEMTKRTFSTKGYMANDMLELVHIEVFGPIVVQTQRDLEYFITYIDNYFRYGYVYLMRRKFESFEEFKEFRAEVIR